MDEQLKLKFVEFLDGLGRRANQGADFVSAEAPELVREWVWWQAVSGLGNGLAMVVAMAVIVWLIRRLVRVWPDCPSDMEPPVVLSGCLLGIVAIPVALYGMHSFERGAKAIVAPRVVAVEKVAELVGLTHGVKK